MPGNTQTSIKNLLEKGDQELEKGKRWLALKTWKAAIELADNDQSSDGLESLDLLDQIADRFLQIKEYVEGEKLDDEIEEYLNGMDSEDVSQEEVTELRVHVQQRRQRRIRHPLRPAKKTEGTPRVPTRAYTLPPLQAETKRRDSTMSEDDAKPSKTSEGRAQSFPTISKMRTFDTWTPCPEFDEPLEEDGELLAQSVQEVRTSDNSTLSTDLRTPEGRADYWFNLLSERTHPFIKGKDEIFQREKVNGRKPRPIRVAILDTGFANTTEADKKKTASFRDKVEKAESFFEDERPEDGWKDEAEHGTSVAFQLTRVCPNAKLFMCRVARTVNGKTDADRLAVARALTKLCEDDKWKVDIINMSFGWERQDDIVDSALDAIQKKGVLLFASASNFGAIGGNNILYPARSPHVIAVDAADGLGDPAPFTSPLSTGHIKARFSAPGCKVKAPGDERVDGTSFSSPIAAGIAALVLEFARQTPLGLSSSIEKVVLSNGVEKSELINDVEKYLKKKAGMLGVFQKMSIQQGPEQVRFLRPWTLLGDDGRVGGDGKPRSKRFFVAQQIIYRLRDEFHKDDGEIGQKVLND